MPSLVDSIDCKGGPGSHRFPLVQQPGRFVATSSGHNGESLVEPGLALQRTDASHEPPSAFVHIPDEPALAARSPFAAALVLDQSGMTADETASMDVVRTADAAALLLPACVGNGVGRETGALRPPPANALTTNPTEDELRVAHLRTQTLEHYLSLTELGHSSKTAMNQCGLSTSHIYGPNSWLTRYREVGTLGLLPRLRGRVGRRMELVLPDWLITAASYFWLYTNHNKDGGSVPAALARAVRLPDCPPCHRERLALVLGVRTLPTCPLNLRKIIEDRISKGQEPVNRKYARRIARQPAVVHTLRNPAQANLNHYSSDGFSKFHITRSQGKTIAEIMRSGDVLEPDDGTINFVVCIPWEMGGDRVSERYGVRIGRFQLLLITDVWSNYIPTFSYVIRPFQRYQTEDILGLFWSFAISHGIPRCIRHEGGPWNSSRVLQTFGQLGIKEQLKHTPRGKTHVESAFNNLWTSLSLLTNGQVGRYRGEMELETKLYERCKRAQIDPRSQFPGLKEVITAIEQAVRERNHKMIDGIYGRWVPAERWQQQLEAVPLRRLNPALAYMFKPYCRTWTVRKTRVGGGIPLFEKHSVPFTFEADFFWKYDGALVKCYFDPYELGSCTATVVLAETFRGQVSGTVLGEAKQTNGIAQYARSMFGLGDGPDSTGAKIRAQNKAAVLREIRSFRPDGQITHAVSERRDGLSHLQKAEVELDHTPTAHTREQLEDLERFLQSRA